MDTHSKDQFLSHIIDEVQTPLKAILKFSDILSKDNNPQTQEKYLKLIQYSAKNLDNIFKDVADISQISNGTFSIKLESFNLRELLTHCFELFRAKAKDKSLRYSLTLGKNLPETIYSDERRLSQVISNLLSNAIKFTTINGAVKLEVVYDPQDNVMKFFVDDNGVGIADDKKNTIFKPIIKDSSNINFDDSRTGLGLSITLSIIELLHGKINFESSEGKGTTFKIEIPLNLNT